LEESRDMLSIFFYYGLNKIRNKRKKKTSGFKALFKILTFRIKLIKNRTKTKQKDYNIQKFRVGKFFFLLLSVEKK